MLASTEASTDDPLSGTAEVVPVVNRGGGGGRAASCSALRCAERSRVGLTPHVWITNLCPARERMIASSKTLNPARPRRSRPSALQQHIAAHLRRRLSRSLHAGRLIRCSVFGFLGAGPHTRITTNFRVTCKLVATQMAASDSMGAKWHLVQGSSNSDARSRASQNLSHRTC